LYAYIQGKPYEETNRISYKVFDVMGVTSYFLWKKLEQNRTEQNRTNNGHVYRLIPSFLAVFMALLKF